MGRPGDYGDLLGDGDERKGRPGTMALMGGGAVAVKQRGLRIRKLAGRRGRKVPVGACRQGES